MTSSTIDTTAPVLSSLSVSVVEAGDDGDASTDDASTDDVDEEVHEEDDHEGHDHGVVTGDLTIEGMTLADAEANEAVFIGAIADSVGVQDEYVDVTISAASRRRRLTDTLTVAYTIETPTLELAEEVAAELGSMSTSEIDAALQAEAADQGVSSYFASIQTTAASTPTASTEGETLDGASAASAFGVVLSAAVGLAALV